MKGKVGRAEEEEKGTKEEGRKGRLYANGSTEVRKERKQTCERKEGRTYTKVT